MQRTFISNPLYRSTVYRQSSRYIPPQGNTRLRSSRPCQFTRNGHKYTHAYSTTPTHLRSGIGAGTLVAAAVAASGILACYYILPYSYSSPPDGAESETGTDTKIFSPSTLPRIWHYPGMPSEIPPGRPGNLTAEQEAKLKELWSMLFGIAGMHGHSESWNPTVEQEAKQAAANTADAQPTDKKHGGHSRFGVSRLLGRGHKDDASNANDADDKYGQLKEAAQALKDQTPAELRDTFWSFSKADDPDGCCAASCARASGTCATRSSCWSARCTGGTRWCTSTTTLSSTARRAWSGSRARATTSRPASARTLSRSGGWARASRMALIGRDGR
ncbi:hypothetical protein MRB53_039379 [Persea americana]|nr:hypothetical protein MRB53_039379 [Persea americana]